MILAVLQNNSVHVLHLKKTMI